VQGADQPPLGVVAIPYADAESKRLALAPGDLLVALTDGYFEAPAYGMATTPSGGWSAPCTSNESASRR